MRVVYFTHSLRSCWNHGNAHFLRGVLRELVGRGHEVRAYEPKGAWSLANLLADAGDRGPGRLPRRLSRAGLDRLSTGRRSGSADRRRRPRHRARVERPGPGRRRRRAARRGARFTLLFHDTHHRAVSDPDAITAFDLSGYDGVLAFGETLSEVYRRWGWGRRVFTWHEAADIRLFHPPEHEQPRDGLVWIGNWGDDERSAELERFLFRPARDVGLPLDIYGVRYPERGP